MNAPRTDPRPAGTPPPAAPQTADQLAIAEGVKALELFKRSIARPSPRKP